MQAVTRKVNEVFVCPSSLRFRSDIKGAYRLPRGCVAVVKADKRGFGLVFASSCVSLTSPVTEIINHCWNIWKGEREPHTPFEHGVRFCGDSGTFFYFYPAVLRPTLPVVSIVLYKQERFVEVAGWGFSLGLSSDEFYELLFRCGNLERFSGEVMVFFSWD